MHSSSSQNEGDRPEKADMGMPVRLVNTPATRCARNPFSRPVVYVDGRTVQRVARGKLWGWAGRQTRRVSRCGGVQMRKRGRRLLCCCARAISKRSQGTNITQRAEIYLGWERRSEEAQVTETTKDLAHTNGENCYGNLPSILVHDLELCSTHRRMQYGPGLCSLIP